MIIGAANIKHIVTSDHHAHIARKNISWHMGAGEVTKMQGTVGVRHTSSHNHSFWSLKIGENITNVCWGCKWFIHGKDCKLLSMGDQEFLLEKRSKNGHNTPNNLKQKKNQLPHLR